MENDARERNEPGGDQWRRGVKEKKGSWVLPGGAPGEVGYCERCGEGLSINLPQPLYIITAAMKAFAEHHGNCPPGQYHAKPAQAPEEWATGRDTGTSSLTIYAAIKGKKGRDREFDIPYDPDDFGRCYRLLKLFPNWRKELDKVIALCPRWKPFVEAWDELTALYEAAGWHKFVPWHSTEGMKGDGGKMYHRMKELEKAAEAVARQSTGGRIQAKNANESGLK
jgi:hypothetical protein